LIFMVIFLVFLVQVDDFSVQHREKLFFSKCPSKIIINNKAEFLELYSKMRFERKEKKKGKKKRI